MLSLLIFVRSFIGAAIVLEWYLILEFALKNLELAFLKFVLRLSRVTGKLKKKMGKLKILCCCALLLATALSSSYLSH